MRKYDIKNKRNIGIIIVISVVIIIMFSLFISLFLSFDKNEYEVSAGTLVFDKDKTIIKVENMATIKSKWNDNYYLIYNDNNYELGSSAIAYNDKTGEIFLYGRYYEIGSSYEINVTEDETVIKNTALTKFYKLADRKYLVVDKEIKSADGLLSTSDFLLVDLDKVGNATLTNHKVNLKAFAETTIVTSNYTFDIANEILTYGSDKIDLKKIIGSSNTYVKEDLIPDEDSYSGTGTGEGTGGAGSGDGSGTGTGEGGTGTGGGSGSGAGGSGTGDGTGTGGGSGGGAGGSGGTGDGTGEEGTGGSGGSGGNSVVIEEVKKAVKETSVISVSSTVNKIRIDYVIYDPKNEYNSVYMEVEREGSSRIETIYLNRSSTVHELTSNIFPNSTYNIYFKYSYVDENNEIIDKYEFDKVTITTKKPSVSVKVTRIKYNQITYLINTDNSYPITSATLITYIGGEEYKREEITNIDGETYKDLNNKSGIITLPVELTTGNPTIELKLEDVKSYGNIIKDVQASYKFKY